MPRTVLVADDNLTVQRMASEMLSEEGMDVITVANGMAAIKKLPDVKPLVVVADVDMPGKNGYEVCDFVKSRPELGYIRVLLVVSDSDPLDGGRGAEVRADGVVKKPFDRQAFVSLVVKSLGEAQALCPPPPPEPAATVEAPESPASATPAYEEIEHTEILDLSRHETLPESFASSYPAEAAKTPLPPAPYNPSGQLDAFQPFGSLEPAAAPVPFGHETGSERSEWIPPGPLASGLGNASEEAAEVHPMAPGGLEVVSEHAPAPPLEYPGGFTASPAAGADDLAFQPPEERESLEPPELSEPPIVDWPASFMAPLEPLDAAATPGGAPLQNQNSEDLSTGLLEPPLPDLAALSTASIHEVELSSAPIESSAGPVPVQTPDSPRPPEPEIHELQEASSLPDLAPLPTPVDMPPSPEAAPPGDSTAQSAVEENHIEGMQEAPSDVNGMDAVEPGAIGLIEHAPGSAPPATDLPALHADEEPSDSWGEVRQSDSTAESSESSAAGEASPAIDVLLVSAVIHAVVQRMAPPALSLDAIQGIERQLVAEIMPDLVAKPWQKPE